MKIILIIILCCLTSCAAPSGSPVVMAHAAEGSMGTPVREAVQQNFFWGGAR